MKKLWEKGVSVNKEIEEFTIGSDRELDRTLARYDIMGTLAHAAMLRSIGILSDQEHKDLKGALLSMYRKAEEGRRQRKGNSPLSRGWKIYIPRWRKLSLKSLEIQAKKYIPAVPGMTRWQWTCIYTSGMRFAIRLSLPEIFSMP
jgi:hypothetical protein